MKARFTLAIISAFPALLLACSDASTSAGDQPVADGPDPSGPVMDVDTKPEPDAIDERDAPEPDLSEPDVDDNTELDGPLDDEATPTKEPVKEVELEEPPPDTTEPEVDLDALEPEAFAGSDWTFDGKSLEPGPLSPDVPPDLTGDGLGATGAPPGDFATEGPSESGADPAAPGAAPPMTTPDGPAPVDAPIVDPIAPPIEPGPGPAPQAGQLTAGEWRDLQNWDFFQSLLDDVPDQGVDFSEMDEEWGYDFSQRISVRVAAGEEPATNVMLTLRGGDETVVWQAMSDAAGSAELYPGLFDDAQGPYTLIAEYGEETAIVTDVVAGGDVSVALDAASGGTGLDLMLMVDTTGSMSDELSYLQAELEDVIERVVSQSDDPLQVRLSVNFYRDTSDQYVVRSFPFTQDIETAIASLRQQSAGGGGDFPEAVDLALEVANQQNWNPKARARLMFLVLDAPPHSDQATQERVRQATEQLAKQGVEVIPLTASGIDKPTEFLMRFLGAATNGSYTFLTDDSGIGGAHLDPHPSIGDYDVEMLNDLLVRIVSERVARPTIALQQL